MDIDVRLYEAERPGGKACLLPEWARWGRSCRAPASPAWIASGELLSAPLLSAQAPGLGFEVYRGLG